MDFRLCKIQHFDAGKDSLLVRDWIGDLEAALTNLVVLGDPLLSIMGSSFENRFLLIHPCHIISPPSSLAKPNQPLTNSKHNDKQLQLSAMAEPTFKAFTYPPLGKTTTFPARSLHRNIVHFDAIFEVDGLADSASDEQFEVILWWRPFAPGHSIVTMLGQDWRPSKFVPKHKSLDQFCYTQLETTGKRLDAFELDLELPLRPDCYHELREDDVDRFYGVDFCLKYRFGDGPW